MKMMETEVEKELAAVVRDWIRAYESRDKALVRQICSDSTKAFHYGTGKDEKIEGLSALLEQLDRDWRQSDKANIELNEVKCQAFDNRFGWIACEMIPSITIAGETHVLPALRGTMVVVKTDAKWKIVHSHVSWPYALQPEGSSFPQY